MDVVEGSIFLWGPSAVKLQIAPILAPAPAKSNTSEMPKDLAAAKTALQPYVQELRQHSPAVSSSQRGVALERA